MLLSWDSRCKCHSHILGKGDPWLHGGRGGVTEPPLMAGRPTLNERIQRRASIGSHPDGSGKAKPKNLEWPGARTTA